MNNNLQNQEPTLTDMTVKAIKMLQKEKNGFFLFVEGGRIDHTHHKNLVNKALEETKEFSRAIDVARKMTNDNETLIVVTADHSHTLTFSGYSSRGSKVNGISEISDKDYFPYETLSYADGPGYASTYNSKRTARVDLSHTDFGNPWRQTSATFPLDYATHAGEDVGVYASGPWSHLFTGNYEQHNIPVLMAFASKIGEFSGSSNVQASFMTIALLVTFAIFKKLEIK
jgi:alkaline phosphatase